MKIGNSKFTVINIAGKIYVNLIIDGEIMDTMKVYGLKDKPFCKRLSQRMYIDGELMEELQAVMSA